MSITALAGVTFEVRATSAPTGLTGTMRFRILDNSGGTAFGPVTAGITEDPAGSGSYVYTKVGGLTTAGQYTAMWDTGTVTPETTAYEDITITGSVPGTGDDLITLDELRTAMEYPADDTSRDDLAAQLITQASLAITRECQREFVRTDDATRTFLWRRGRRLDLTPFDLRTVTSLTVHAGTAQETTATADTDYRLLPVVNRDGVYMRVEFAPDFDPDVSDYEESFGVARVTIAGAWGYAAAPEPVKRACAVTVASWMAHDVAANALADLDEPRGLAPAPPRQYAIPTPAWRLLSPYMRRTIR